MSIQTGAPDQKSVVPAQARGPGKEPNLVERIRVIRIHFSGKYPELILFIDTIPSTEQAPEITTPYLTKKLLARNNGVSENLSIISYAENKELSQDTQVIFMNLQGRMDKKAAIVKIEKLLNHCAALMHMPTTPA